MVVGDIGRKAAKMEMRIVGEVGDDVCEFVSLLRPAKPSTMARIKV